MDCQFFAKSTSSEFGKVKKVKVTLVQALRLCTGRTAHRGSRNIAVLFHDPNTKRGWVVSFTPRPLFTSGKEPVPIVQEAGRAPGPVWKVTENLAPTGIRSWTVQPVASCYTDYANRPTFGREYHVKISVSWAEFKTVATQSAQLKTALSQIIKITPDIK
jgi:hypothetical protein